MKKLLSLLWASLLCIGLYAEETIEMQRLLEARRKYSIGLELHQEHNAEGELTHLGVAIFCPEMQQVLNPHLWRGIERIVLRIALQGSDAARSRWMQENNIRLFLEATPFGSGSFKSFDKAIPILKQITGVKVHEDFNRYRVLISGGPDETTLRVSIPKERELIYGTDKKEEDERQAQRLRSFRQKAITSMLPQKEELRPTSHPEVWHTVGDVFYIDSLCADGYYRVTDGGNLITPLWSPQHPKESVRNLMLGNVLPDGLKVEVIHHQYGGHIVTWESDWATLLAALKEEGVMEPFASAQYLPQKDMLTGILVLRNTSFAFTHMLLLSVPMTLLRDNQPTRLTAMLYTNTPQHNVYALFEEFLPKNK